MNDELRTRVSMDAHSFSRSIILTPDLTASVVAGDDDFEFILTSFESDPVFLTADETFSDGRISHVYPVFDRDLLDEKKKSGQETKFPALDFWSRDLHSGWVSSSSSISTAVEDADGKETFCVWALGPAPQSPERQCKGGSTVSITRRIWDMVFGRNRSNGIEKIAFLQGQEHKVVGNKCIFISNLDEAEAEAEAEKNIKSGKAKQRDKAAKEIDIVTAHRTYYGKAGRAATAANRSYLPYRQEIVRFSCLGSRLHL